MPRYLYALILTLSLAAAGVAQEEQPAGETGDAAAPETGTAVPDLAPAGDEADEEAVDDADLDVQTYEEDDDDFVPTEEIPADEPIPFPSNI